MLLFATLFLLVFPQKTLAVSVNDDSFKEPNATYTVESVVDGEPETVSAVIGGETYLFVDRDPTDDTHNLKYYDEGLICNMTRKPGGDKTSEGINHTGNTQSLANGETTAWPGANIWLSYSGDTDEDCREGAADEFLPETLITLYSNSPETNTSNNGNNGPTGDNELASYLVGGGDSSACAANSNTTMEWLLCPIINAISKFTDQMNNFVEGQLHFRVGQLLPNDGQVNKAWTIIKNIVAGLVVILMLVMVISQAVGGQFFDAYTVKKMLPRLVIAVIAMQFSWVLGKWLITLANDLGEGLKQIMLAPFGGSGNMDLPSIMHHLNGTYPAVTTAAIFGVFLVFIFTFKEFILPIFLFIALALGSALIIALATLVFRNILIIMAIIFAPLALLLWATPGQTMQGYWKKYADNFGKLLLFFPLVMAMIYTGRIAAWLAGGLGAPSLIEYFIVLVAFFGPYFFLPKTFKWGGQLLGAINQGINQNKALNIGKSWGNKKIGEWMKDTAEEQAAKYNPKDSRYRAGRFQPKTRFGKLLYNRGVLGKMANVYNPETDEMERRRIGRRNFMRGEGRWATMLRSGTIIPTKRNIDKLIASGERAKERGDIAAATREKRIGEAMRSGDIGGMEMALDYATGKYKPVLYPKGAKGEDENAYFAKLTEMMDSPQFRESGMAAKFLATHRRWGIHGYGRHTWDPSNRRYKKRRELEDELLDGEHGEFDLRTMGDKERDAFNEWRALERNEARTAGEEERFKKLDLLFALRMGNVRPVDAKTAEQIRKNIATVKATKGEVLEEYGEGDGSWAEFANTEEQKENGEAVYLIPNIEHPAFERKEVSDDEAQQGIERIDFTKLPVVKSKWKTWAAGKRLRKNTNPDSLAVPMGMGEYGPVDEFLYALGDHASINRWFTFNESAWGELAHQARQAKQSFNFGRMGRTKQGGFSQMPADATLDFFVNKAVGELDTNTLQLLTHLNETESTKVFANGVFGSSLKPSELPVLWDRVRGLPDDDLRKQVAVHQIRKMYEHRDALGIARDDDRDVTVDDIRQAGWGKYYGATPQQYRQTMGYEEPAAVPLAAAPPADLPPDAIPPPPPIPTGGGRRMRPGVAGAPPMVDFDDPGVGGTGATLPRWQYAQQALNSLTPGRPVLNRVQQRAVQTAHEVGTSRVTHPDGTVEVIVEAGRDGTPARVGNYTDAQLRQKAEILRSAGFTPEERRVLIERGIVGEPDSSKTVTANVVRESPSGVQRSASTGSVATDTPRSSPVITSPEIEGLQAQHRELFQKIGAATDQAVKAQLREQMAQIEHQMSQKTSELSLTVEGPGIEAAATQPAEQAARQGGIAQAGTQVAITPPAPALPVFQPPPAPAKTPTTAPAPHIIERVERIPAGGVSLRGGPVEGSTRIQHGQAATPAADSPLAQMRARIAQDELRHALQDTMREALRNTPSGRAIRSDGGKESYRNAVDPDKFSDDAARRISERNPRIY